MLTKTLPFSRESLLPSKFFSQQITITSETGVGGTTTYEELKGVFERDLKWKFVSGGEIMREFAERNSMFIDEFVHHISQNDTFDHDTACDISIQSLAESKNNLIVESRLAHIQGRGAFHVRLTCSIELRARRRKVPEATIMERDTKDSTRYDKLYPGWNWPDSDFDLVMSTEENTPAQIVREILLKHGLWRSQNQDRMLI